MISAMPRILKRYESREVKLKDMVTIYGPYQCCITQREPQDTSGLSIDELRGHRSSHTTARGRILCICCAIESDGKIPMLVGAVDMRYSSKGRMV